MRLTKICWHLIASASTPDFLVEVGLNLASSCGHKTTCWISACCWLGQGSMSIGDLIKSHLGGDGAVVNVEIAKLSKLNCVARLKIPSTIIKT